MVLNFFLLIISLVLVVKSADLAIRYSTKLAESLNLSKYIVGFLIVAVISVLPETFIAITSAVENNPSLGLGVLFGSNIADLTLVFALVVLIAGHDLKIKSKIIKNRGLYITALSAPIIFGLNGYYSRVEGLALINIGCLFYYLVLRKNTYKIKIEKEKFEIKNLLFLLASMAGLLLGANLTVNYGTKLALSLHASSVIIGMFFIGLGAIIPELFFSIKAAKGHQDNLAMGDILGTVIADSTIVVGAMALIKPFSFNPRIIYISGLGMILASFLLFHFMKSDKALTKKEVFRLLLFYAIFILAEMLINF